jgi:hypothetical protein
MSVGAWTPEGLETKTTATINPQVLPALAAISENEALDNIAGHLSAEQIIEYRSWMKVDIASWQEAATELNQDQLIHLIRFFTIAEMQLEGWEAGNDSPVIALNKLLKKSGGRLDKETLMWMRENSNNRFIPNGAII